MEANTEPVGSCLRISIMLHMAFLDIAGLDEHYQHYAFRQPYDIARRSMDTCGNENDDL